MSEAQCLLYRIGAGMSHFKRLDRDALLREQLVGVS